MSKASTVSLGRLRITITLGNRSYSEVVDLGEEWEHFAEAGFSCKRPTWKQWTRPLSNITEKKMRNLSGNHLIFGWLEALCQSDFSPIFCLTEFNDAKDFTYSVSEVF